MGLFIGLVLVLGGAGGYYISQGQNEIAIEQSDEKGISSEKFFAMQQLKNELEKKDRQLKDLRRQVSQQEQHFIAQKLKLEESPGHKKLQAILEDFFNDTKFEVYSQGPYLAVRMPHTAFALSSSILSDEAVKSLKTVSEILQKHNEKYFLIVEGHTDNVGFKPGSSISSNRQLGALRAFQVMRALESFQAKPRDMMLASWGEYMPVIDYKSETPEAKNRRIELVFAPRRVVKKIIKTPEIAVSEQG